VIKRYKVTSKGPRASNQDYVLVEDLPGGVIFASVADGVGRNKGGEVASKTASETLVATLRGDGRSLEESFEIANCRLKDLAQSDPALAGMATTLTAILIAGLRLTGAHAGDSRVYILRRNGIRQLTEDHTEAAKLIREGSLAKHEAQSHPYRNLLYSALGSAKDLVIETFAFDLLPKDRILIMSDGVYSVVSKRTFRDISLKHGSFEGFCNAVLELVEGGRPNDNFSIVALEIEDGAA
jgi:PPM family protein phosphatase